jgi:Fe2+ transport system protein FeoA
MNAPLPSLPGSQTLNRFAPGSQVRVLGVAGDLPVRRRLLEMGLCPGVAVDVIRRAPLGDPLEVRVRGYLLSLRLDQAAQVSVVASSVAVSAVA